MKHSSRATFFMTMIAGVLGLLLRFWLLSAEDSRNLLPSWHISTVLLILLSAGYLVFLFFQTRKMRTLTYPDLFPASPVSGALTVLAALALALYTVSAATALHNRLLIPMLLLGAAAVVCMLAAAWYRFQGKALNLTFLIIITLYLMSHMAVQSQTWEHIPQSVRFLPPMLASVFLLIGSYHQAAFSVQEKSADTYVFSTQAALYFCLLSLTDAASLFYLAMALWTASGSLSSREG